VKVRLLGPLEIVDDAGQPIAIPGGRQRTLLALLALNAGRVSPGDRLIDDLWGSAAPQQPGNALQIAVFKLRRALGAELIETRPPGYVLALRDDDVDAYRFEGLVREARAALADGKTESAIECFDAALGLWRGDALAEFGDVPTVRAAVSRLDELRAATVEDRFDALLAMGHDADLVPDLDAAIAAMPFRERLRGQLMLALYRSGRQADALRAFRDARTVLAEELGLEPGPELRRLEAAILGQDEALDAPAPPQPAARPSGREATPTNLRPSLSSFVGRERDLAGIGELLDGHRLVTLVGAGGCGKTRLASEFALGRLDRYPGGVWFAGLDTVASGDDVAAAVAEAVGLSSVDAAGQPALAATGALDRLRTMLSDRSALVVLDNCEHVIDDAARLADGLLAVAPGLRLLATSREALRVPGERVWRVPPLSNQDAVTLFTERARAARGDFELSDVDRAVVADVCERVDGMPLAVELTAAHASAFTVSQLAARLDDRFRLVTGGARTALPRHQTLRAVTDWSYDLLFDDERIVFERLTAFTGDCSLDAAEAVCSDDELPLAEIGGLIGRLVDKSLVVADGSGRFRLLQTLAQYGRERLAAGADGGDAARARHAAYYADLAEQSAVDWRRSGGNSQTWWLACLTTELDNVRVALDWSIRRGDGPTAQRLAGNMGWYWWHAGRAVEGHRWLEDAIACAGPTDLGIRARAVTWAAWVAIEAGDADAAARHAAEAIELSEQVFDHTYLGLAWTVSAELALLDGNADLAASSLDLAQAAHDAVDDQWHKGIAASLRMWAASLRGQRETAEREAVTAVGVFRSVGDVCTLVATLNQYSRMLESAGKLDEADEAAREARDVSEAFGLRGWASTMRARLGSRALVRGDAARAAGHYRAAIELARDLALPTAEAEALEGLALAHERDGDHEAARRCREEARALTDRLGRPSTAPRPVGRASGVSRGTSACPRRGAPSAGTGRRRRARRRRRA
jgi:predicted ATPase/DNA-binding SARP family transcriptional activator